MALWVDIHAGNYSRQRFLTHTPQGRGLAFMLSLFGYAIFGYITATLEEVKKVITAFVGQINNIKTNESTH